MRIDPVITGHYLRLSIADNAVSKTAVPNLGNGYREAMVYNEGTQPVIIAFHSSEAVGLVKDLDDKPRRGYALFPKEQRLLGVTGMNYISAISTSGTQTVLFNYIK